MCGIIPSLVSRLAVILTDGYATFNGNAAMRLRPLSRLSATLALWMIGSSLVPLPAPAGEAAATAALIAEARRAFTLNGKQIPPEIFRDFGDGDLADSGAIWVTVDVKAAIGSNLYYDAIKHEGACSRQTKAGIGPGS